MREPQESSLQELTFDSFQDSKTISVSGQNVPAYPSGHDCVYFEWAFGNRSEKKWESYSVGFQSEVQLNLKTENGKMTVSRADIRLYLNPAVEKYYTKESEAPEAVRAWIREHGSVSVAEYRLETGKKYFAVLHVDHYYLPRPGGPPSSHSKKVLWISDEPIKDGKPSVEITPAYRGWTY